MIVSIIRKNKLLIAFIFITSSLVSFGEILNTLLINKILDTAIEQTENFLFLFLLLLGALMLGAAFTFLSRYLSNRFSSNMAERFMESVHATLVNQPISFFETNHSGDLIARFTNDIEDIENYIRTHFSNLLFQPILLICASCYMIYINWQLFIISIVLLPCAVHFSNKLSKRMEQFQLMLKENAGNLNFFFQSVIEGQEVARVYHLKQHLNRKFDALTQNILNNNLNLTKKNALVPVISTVLNAVPYGLCIIYGGLLTLQGTISISQLLVSIYLLKFIVQPASTIPTLITSTKLMAISLRRIEFIVKHNKKEERSLTLLTTEDDALELKDINFGYTRNQPAIRDFSFTFKKNKSYAIVGPSGSGKSTIFKLICAFYEPTSGRIAVHANGKNATRIQDVVSWVDQDNFLFPVSIYKNISFGRADATREEVIEAAKLANAHDFIVSLPDGYETVVGERGSTLSGGQKQRIAIARAILKDADILLLDEPTSALDSKSESIITSILGALSRKKTIIMVGHRFSTIVQADQIIVVHEGKIIDSGTHEQLLENCDLYRRMFELQLSSPAEVI